MTALEISPINFKTTSHKLHVNNAFPLKSARSIQELYLPVKTSTENPLYRFYPPNEASHPDFFTLRNRNRASEKCTMTFLGHIIIFILTKL